MDKDYEPSVPCGGDIEAVVVKLSETGLEDRGQCEGGFVVALERNSSKLRSPRSVWIKTESYNELERYG